MAKRIQAAARRIRAAVTRRPRARAAAVQPAAATHHRLEIKCGKCDPCVLVTTVPAGADGKPDPSEVTAAILAAGWKVNKANQPICPDCW